MPRIQKERLLTDNLQYSSKTAVPLLITGLHLNGSQKNLSKHSQGNPKHPPCTDHCPLDSRSHPKISQYGDTVSFQCIPKGLKEKLFISAVFRITLLFLTSEVAPDRKHWLCVWLPDSTIYCQEDTQISHPEYFQQVTLLCLWDKYWKLLILEKGIENTG